MRKSYIFFKNNPFMSLRTIQESNRSVVRGLRFVPLLKDENNISKIHIPCIRKYSLIKRSIIKMLRILVLEQIWRHP